LRRALQCDFIGFASSSRIPLGQPDKANRGIHNAINEFGQLGAFLNELTDVVSDAALYLPLDLYALWRHPGWVAIAVLAINLIVVWVLVRDLLVRRY